MTEIWRPIPGFPHYEASDLGRIRSLYRRQPHIMATYVDRMGYTRVPLSEGGKVHRLKVHRLVLLTFIGAGGELDGCHNDGDRRNNALSNLRWDTRSANAADMLTHGTHFNASKATCPEGHPYEGDNLIETDRERRCRSCQRANGVRARARNRSKPNAQRRHGTLWAYQGGCRCDACRSAKSASRRKAVSA